MSAPTKAPPKPILRANALPKGHLLEEYQIEAVLGAGGFGVTYKALDIHLETWVAVKEYFPVEWSFRASDGVSVRPNTQGQFNTPLTECCDYEWGLERFLDEARTLARIQHPFVVRIKRYFRANGTAYIVMDYEDGEPLSAILREGVTFTEQEILGLLEDVLPALQAVHAQGYLHRDLKPSNLYVRSTDQRVLLIDFGAARAAIGHHSRSVTSLITPGFSPPEQYTTRMDRYGPWSDLYALGAVLYRCVTGHTPMEAAERLMEDRLPPARLLGADRYSYALLSAIDRSLAIRWDERFRDVAQLQEALSAPEPAPASSESAVTVAGQTQAVTVARGPETLPFADFERTRTRPRQTRSVQVATPAELVLHKTRHASKRRRQLLFRLRVTLACSLLLLCTVGLALFLWPEQEIEQVARPADVPSSVTIVLPPGPPPHFREGHRPVVRPDPAHSEDIYRTERRPPERPPEDWDDSPPSFEHRPMDRPSEGAPAVPPPLPEQGPSPEVRAVTTDQPAVTPHPAPPEPSVIEQPRDPHQTLEPVSVPAQAPEIPTGTSGIADRPTAAMPTPTVAPAIAPVPTPLPVPVPANTLPLPQATPFVPQQLVPASPAPTPPAQATDLPKSTAPVPTATSTPTPVPVPTATSAPTPAPKPQPPARTPRHSRSDRNPARGPATVEEPPPVRTPDAREETPSAKKPARREKKPPAQKRSSRREQSATTPSRPSARFMPAWSTPSPWSGYNSRD